MSEERFWNTDEYAGTAKFAVSEVSVSPLIFTVAPGSFISVRKRNLPASTRLRSLQTCFRLRGFFTREPLQEPLVIRPPDMLKAPWLYTV